MGQGSGDKLARGAARATFQTTAGGVSKSKWDAAFGDFDPQKFQDEPSKSRVKHGEIPLTVRVGIKANRN